MEPFTSLESVACALPYINIDTDQLLPARFMKQPREPGAGYDRFLFHDLRRNSDGSPDSTFPLNDPLNASARIIAARQNFGSGSSREAAVYALVDAGVRCVIAPSHGDIFSSNAVNNGLLPARMAATETEELLTLLAPGGVSAKVDLHACTVHAAGRTFAFAVDPVWRLRLLNGWDDIDMTRTFAADISRWAAADRASRPWAQHMPQVAP
jgi:3-isopropylmalate/(R)-2-methylmalate dehydratase small subunit